MIKNSIRKKINTITTIIGLGIVETSFTSLIVLLLFQINDYAILGVIIIWLFLGWISTYLIHVKTLEIIFLIVTNFTFSILIYFCLNIIWWFALLLSGISIFFWIIAFMFKFFLFSNKHH